MAKKREWNDRNINKETILQQINVLCYHEAFRLKAIIIPKRVLTRVSSCKTIFSFKRSEARNKKANSCFWTCSRAWYNHWSCFNCTIWLNVNSHRMDWSPVSIPSQSLSASPPSLPPSLSYSQYRPLYFSIHASFFLSLSSFHYLPASASPLSLSLNLSHFLYLGLPLLWKVLIWFPATVFTVLNRKSCEHECRQIDKYTQ